MATAANGFTGTDIGDITGNDFRTPYSVSTASGSGFTAFELCIAIFL